MRTKSELIKGILALALLLVGLTVGATGTSEREAKITLRAMDRASGDPCDTAMKTLVKDFEILYPNMSIKRPVISPSPSEADVSIKTALASSTAPDYIDCMGKAYIQSIQMKGILLDITEEVKSWGKVFLNTG